MIVRKDSTFPVSAQIQFKPLLKVSASCQWSILSRHVLMGARVMNHRQVFFLTMVCIVCGWSTVERSFAG